MYVLVCCDWVCVNYNCVLMCAWMCLHGYVHECDYNAYACVVMYILSASMCICVCKCMYVYVLCTYMGVYSCVYLCLYVDAHVFLCVSVVLETGAAFAEDPDPI